MALRQGRLRGAVWPVCVWIVSSGALLAYEAWWRSANADRLVDGYRFQAWSSDWMMQTISVSEMQGLGSPMFLWYSHVYPPGLDALRYLLIQGDLSSGVPVDVTALDNRLYVIWALLYGLLNLLVFVWVRDLTRSNGWALGGTAVWALYPGMFMVATLLEGSISSLLFVSAMFYFLYRFLKTRRPVYSTAALFMLLLSSLMRSTVQSYVFVVLAVSLVAFWWMSARPRRLWTILNVVVVALIAVVPIKQLVMYGTLETTFAGYHRVGMLQLDPRQVAPIPVPQEYVDNALRFSSKYNTQETLKDNYRMNAAANAFITSHPVEAVRRALSSASITLPEALRGSSIYTTNHFVEELPWTDAHIWVFSQWRYLLLILGSLGLFVWSRGWRGVRAGLRRYGWLAVFWCVIALPVVLSNRYRPGQEDLGPIWTDAIRLKMLLEVPVYVFITFALYLGVQKARQVREARSRRVSA